MNGLKIFSENFLNEYDTIAVVSGDVLKAYLYDQKQASQWSSSGSDDLTEESIEITFKNWQGEAVDRTFDRLVILNHNLKAITADYWDGAAWVPIAEATLTLAAAYTIIEIVAPITAARVRVNCTTAQVVDAEKVIGELKVCLSVLEDVEWRSSFPRSDSMRGGDFRLSDGAVVAWKEWTKAGGSLSLDNVKLADLQAVMPFIKSAAFLTIVFYSDFDLSETFEFVVANAPNPKLDRKMALFTVSLELEEK